MSTTNSTEDAKSYYELICTREFIEGLYTHLITLLVLNIFIFITAVIGNALILIALHKESSLHPPSKLLLRSLATSDLFVGIIVEPCVTTYFVSTITEHWSICRSAYEGAFLAGYILGSVSLFTLTAISVDRLLALLLGLKYRQAVTLKRTYLFLIVFWAVSIAGTMVKFYDPRLVQWYGKVGIILCLAISGFCYGKIFLILRHQRTQVQELFILRSVSQTQHEQLAQVRPPSHTNSSNITCYRKTVFCALWVQLALVVCYVPYGVLLSLTTQRDSAALYIPNAYGITLLYLNSSLNPLLYCWKIKEVRQAVTATFRQLRQYLN